MRRDYRLLFGPLAALLLTGGVLGLAPMVPGYDQVRQTVSEIGEVGSPAQGAFTALLCAVSVSLLVFIFGLRRFLLNGACSTWPAYLAGVIAVSTAGVGVFSFPHPLHNVFGLIELLGYQAPLALALALAGKGEGVWRRLRLFSWMMATLVWVAIILNLTTFHRHGALWVDVRPIYGLFQRALFASWFGWAAGIGWMAFERPAPSSSSRSA